MTTSLLGVFSRPFVTLFDIARSTSPILRRELISLLRTRLAFWVTVTTVASASLFPLVNWPESDTTQPFLAAQRALSAYRGTFTFLLFLFVPIVTAGAITTERERGTYELLYSTHIRPTGIVLGKLLASIGFFLLLVVLTFPVVCVLFLLGGFELVDFLFFFLNLVGLIVFLGIVGLWASMRSRRTIQAILTAFGFLIACYFAFVIGVLSLTFGTGGAGVDLTTWELVLYGCIAVVSLLLLLSLVQHARFPELAVSRRRERRLLGRERPSKARKRVSRTWLTRWILWHCRGGIPEKWNPIFVSSLRSEIFGNARFRRLTFWGLLLLYGAIGAVAWTNDSLSVLVWILPQVSFFCGIILMPGMSATHVASEYELGRFDLLRGTLVTPRQMLLGKFSGSLFGALAIFCPTAIAALGTVLILDDSNGRDFVWGEDLHPGEFFASALVALAVVLVFGAAAGLLASSLRRKTAPAVIIAYFLTIAYFALLPIGDEIRGISPMTELISSYMPQLHGSEFFFLTSCIVTLGFSALQIVAATVLLRRLHWRET